MDTVNISEKAEGGQPRAAGKELAGETPISAGDVGLVNARGTGEGLVLRLDGSRGLQLLEDELRDFLVARRTFIAGQEVILEWVHDMAPEEMTARVQEVILSDFDVRVRCSRVFSRPPVSAPRVAVVAIPDRDDRERFHDSLGGEGVDEGLTSLFSGVEEIDGGVGAIAAEVDELSGSAWDDANAKVVCSTLRSGQRIESEHTVVVLGDVNSGAEIVSGGHVIVLGALRGVAHAGAFEESSGPAYIVALSLQPTQLRIGSVISRSSGRTGGSGGGPEIARVDGDLIVVEKYHPRVVAHRGPRTL